MWMARARIRSLFMRLSFDVAPFYCGECGRSFRDDRSQWVGVLGLVFRLGGLGEFFAQDGVLGFELGEFFANWGEHVL